MKHFVVSVLLLSSLAQALAAQTRESAADVLTDRERCMSCDFDRAAMVAEIRAIENRRLAAAKKKARRMGLPMVTEKPDGTVIELVDFDGDKPLYITTMNVNAAISTAADTLRSAPYALDGAGVTVGVWDRGSGRSTHQEFALPGGGSRVVKMNPDRGPGSHATHVIGTIAAAGVDPAARGMASAVRIESFDRTNDLSEMTERAATAPGQLETYLYLSNQSYGPIVGWAGNYWHGDGKDADAAEHRFGRYQNVTRNIDALAYNAPYFLPFRSAGNERDDNPQPGDIVRLEPVGVSNGTSPEIHEYDPELHPPGDGVYRDGFDTIAPDAIGKNIITVGAVEDAVTDGSRDPSVADVTIFSSFGPADDGRIKPDLVANGSGVYSTSAVGDDTYIVFSGTSMSSPNAVGSAALLVQLYSRLFPGDAMRASTLKGLLIHTADDLGNPGPDYKYGWGLVNVRRAADHLIYHDSFPDRMRLTEDEISEAQPLKTYSFEWDGQSALRATLSWTDPPGEATDVHDSRVPTLVNDLNLKLIAPDGTEYFPFVMPFVGTWTTESMSLPATTGVNHTDNVEQVRIESSEQPGTWQAEVSYVGALTDGVQQYGLLISEDVDPFNIDRTPPNPDPMGWERAPAAGAGPILHPIAGTDFTGRTVNGATASNIQWTTTGVSNPGNLKTTGNFNLFDTEDAQDHFAPSRNLASGGAWTIEIPLNLTEPEFLLTDVVLDHQQFNNNGAYQSADRTVDWTVTLVGSTSGEIRSMQLDGRPSTSGTINAVFDPPVLLSDTESYTMAIAAVNTDAPTNIGLAGLSINGQFGIAGDLETQISMTATTAEDFSGVEYYFAETTGRAGGSDSGWQDSPTYVDSGLIPGTTYSYTVTARDKSPLRNATSPSAPVEATTQGEPPAFYAWSDGMPFDVDDNADGVANGIAWMLGADGPQTNATHLLPVHDNSDPDFFIFTFRRSDSAIAAGASVVAQYTSDLGAEWTTATAGSDVIINVTENGIAFGVDEVEVKLSRSLADGGRLFVRLLVNTP